MDIIINIIGKTRLIENSPDVIHLVHYIVTYMYKPSGTDNQNICSVNPLYAVIIA